MLQLDLQKKPWHLRGQRQPTDGQSLELLDNEDRLPFCGELPYRL